MGWGAETIPFCAAAPSAPQMMQEKMLKFFSNRDDENESLLGGGTEGEDGFI